MTPEVESDRSAANVKLIERWTELFARCFVSGEPIGPEMEPFFEPDADYYPVRKFPEASPCHGVEEIARFFDTYRTSWERVEWVTDEISAVGDDRVVARGRLAGEGRGSGMSLGGQVYFCYWVRGGRIYRQEDHLTEAGMMRAYGLDSAEAPG